MAANAQAQKPAEHRCPPATLKPAGPNSAMFHPRGRSGYYRRPPADIGQATWPASAPLSTTLASGADPNPADEVVSVDHRAMERLRTTIQDLDRRLRRVPRQRQGKSLVMGEAAAAAWLNKREVEGKSEKALSAGEPASSDAVLRRKRPTSPELDRLIKCRREISPSRFWWSAIIAFCCTGMRDSDAGCRRRTYRA